MIYKAKKNQRTYGHLIGIICLDTQFTPLIPGDVGNASSFEFPVIYKVVKGLTVDRAVNKDVSFLKPLLDAGNKLIANGVRAITTNCGYLGFFQKELADNLDIPVFLSSLLQLPFMLSMIGKNKKVGILCAKEETFDKSLLKAVGVKPTAPIVVKGMDEYKYFNRGIMKDSGELDATRIENEIVAATSKMVEEDPSIRSLLLECADMPPYSTAVQRAIKLPIFDFITMINYVFSTIEERKYKGLM